MGFDPFMSPGNIGSFNLMFDPQLRFDKLALGATSIDKIGEVRLSDEIGGGGV